MAFLQPIKLRFYIDEKKVNFIDIN